MNTSLEDSENEEKSRETYDQIDLFKPSEQANKKSGKKEHRCNVCGKDFTRNDVLKRHMFTHLDIKPFSCEVCSKTFRREDHLMTHSRTHYKDDAYNDSDLESGKMHTCDICLKQIVRKDNFKKHMLTHSAIKPFSCKVCLKKFRRKDHLEKHMRTHPLTHEDNSLSGALFDLMSENMLHRQVNASNETVVKFQESLADCGDVDNKEGIFDQMDLDNSATEQDTKKSGRKSHKCGVCSKIFGRSDHLKKHLIIHSDIKPHICEICSRPFGRKDHLEKHYRTHSKNNSVLEFDTDSVTGDICFDVTFIDEQNVDIDDCNGEKDEENINYCSWKDENGIECGKCFTHRKQLQKHIKTHTKSYKCDICPRAFSRRDRLAHHIERHSKLQNGDLKSDKTHKCDVCSKTFAKKYVLKRHMEVHSRVQPSGQDHLDEHLPPQHEDSEEICILGV